MPAWDNESKGGKFIKMPPIGGEPIKFKIKTTKRVDGESKFNLKGKGGEDLKYHYEITTDDDKTVTINTWALIRALAQGGIQEGDTISVRRPEKGNYVVTKKPIEREPTKSLDLSYLKDIEKKYAGEEKAEW